MAEPRCDLTELPKSGCAHCRNIGNHDPAAEHEHDLGPWIEAQYTGRCADCTDPIQPGDHIRSDGDDGWLCTRCGTPPGHPTRDVPIRGDLL